MRKRNHGSVIPWKNLIITESKHPQNGPKNWVVGRFCIAEGPVQWSVAFAPPLLGLLAMVGWFRHSISAADRKFVALSGFQNRKERPCNGSFVIHGCLAKVLDVLF